MAKAPPTIAATSTLAMIRTAGARGIETADVLKEAGLTPAFLEDPDARIPAPTVLAIWNTLRQRTADPALQLVAPTSLPFGAYRVIDYLVAASGTVGEGVDRFARYFRLIAQAISLSVEPDRGDYALVLAREDGHPVPPVYVDYVFAALVGRVRMKIRPELAVSRVELRQVAPAVTAPYEEVFQCQVRFGASADRLIFSAREWAMPVATADVALARVLEEHARILAQQMPEEGPGFTTDVEKTIASALPEGGTVDEVARSLNVSVRTLQRKLVEAGTTFKEVSDSVRGRLAEGYLTDPKVSISEVAFLLGFAEQSSFNRAFRRWTGETPGKWRRLHA